MDVKILDGLPCGYVALNDSGTIQSINQPLVDRLGYTKDELHQKHFDVLLSPSARLFYQLYFFPMMRVQEKIEEMYISLLTNDGVELPVLLNANRKNKGDTFLNECIVIPMSKRNEFEDELIQARKDAEMAFEEKNKANEALEVKQRELLILLNKNKLYQEKIETELQLAKKIQEVSLTLPIHNEEISITTFYKPSSELSGDIFGIYNINDFQYGVIIIDVMGHGISSALVSLSLRSLFQTLISKGESVETVIKELDHYLNTLFENNSDIRHYATGIHLHINTEKREIEFINAGHPPVVIIDNEEINYLHSTSPPIGLLDDLEFKASKVSYTNTSRLFLYTDGITDLVPIKELSSVLKDCNDEQPAVLKNILSNLIQEKEKNFSESDDQSFMIIDLL
ncbi:SpoIIE family protein phosphatase [Anaerobacillus alkaliphilus]|nr:SpoIIE family protein phosphatase [Anaerobacillus alkaliphilus]